MRVEEGGRGIPFRHFGKIDDFVEGACEQKESNTGAKKKKKNR